MKDKHWKANEALIHLFQTVGRASLLYDIQDSHCGNMVMRWIDERGKERMAITATGSQKGDLEPEHICFPSLKETDFGYYKASSESDIHAKILALEGVNASMHCHTKDLIIDTLDDEKKPSRPEPFYPTDPLGYYHLGGIIPVDWFALPSGSPQMVKVIPDRLSRHPVTLVQAHGAFSKGRTLTEAFFLQCVANNSGYIVRMMKKLDVDVEDLRGKIKSDPHAQFSYPLHEYRIEDDEACQFPKEEELVKEFYKTGARIFESRLSAFHTGSVSIRGVNTMFYAPNASMPREIGGPLLEISLSPENDDTKELEIHKFIYKETNFQAICHCWVPEAEAHAKFRYPGESKALERIIPIDAEGSYLYLVIPVLPPVHDIETFLQLLHDYKVVVVQGGGVWGVGSQSLSEVLHHPSSVREICLYRIGAYERGLDLRKMEPKKAHNW
ncbi:MAG: class II aldolase/adducin family protein [Candidatus Aminicenantes bacterium]|nr:MAG: class II aldolase/adducin family protein [Candidatus Aminicenantes bacterium]